LESVANEYLFRGFKKLLTGKLGPFPLTAFWLHDSCRRHVPSIAQMTGLDKIHSCTYVKYMHECIEGWEGLLPPGVAIAPGVRAR